MNKTRVLILGIVLIVGGMTVFYVLQNASQNSTPTILSFEDCIAGGNPIMESYPRQCRAGNRAFVENIGNTLEKQDMIQLATPHPNDAVSSPLTLQGQARGNWYFEASFPVQIKDATGKILGQIPAEAQGDWMTTEFVPFKAILEFSAPTTATGTLILKKDNPSGLPEHDDELVIPIIFGTSSAPQVSIASQFKERVVYQVGNVTPVLETEMRNDCQSRGGVFNTCGSMCANGMICAQVCAYTCELDASYIANQTTKVKMYFNNTRMNPNVANCSAVYPVEHIVPKTTSVAHAALTELFYGPSSKEQVNAYSSPFSGKTADILKDIKIVNGTAYVDLADFRSLVPNVSTSCGSAQFLNEMDATLRQFPSIRKVIYAINGDVRLFYEFLQFGCTTENNNCDNTPFKT